MGVRADQCRKLLFTRQHLNKQTTKMLGSRTFKHVGNFINLTQFRTTACPNLAQAQMSSQS